MSTFSSTEIGSTQELNEIIEKWTQKEDISVQEIKKLLVWMDGAHSLQLQPDAVTFSLLLERVLQLPDREADPIVSLLLGNLFELMVSDSVGFGSTSHNLLPPKPIEWYMNHVMNRFIYGAQQTQKAQEWLVRWWEYHDSKPQSVSPPTPRAYEKLMTGWREEGMPNLVTALLQDMLSTESIRPDMQHFESCLNALVEEVTYSRRKTQRHVLYNGEAVLLQMSEWLNSHGSELAADGHVDSTGRSSQTIVLQNLTKVVKCWVDSRQHDAAARVTKILDLSDDIFRESRATAADWVSLSETYSHAIRTWSHAATTKNRKIRTVLAQETGIRDISAQTEKLLLRLEEWAGNADVSSQPVEIPLKTWRRVYASAIAACGSEYDEDRREENHRRAWSLWDRFKARGYGDLNIDMYNHMFHVFGKAGDIQSSGVLWGELKEDPSVVPDLKTFNWRLLAVKNCTSWSTEADRWAQAKNVWNRLRQNGHTPDVVSVNIYISSFMRTTDLTTAREGDAAFRGLLDCRGDRMREASTLSLNLIVRMWSNFATYTRDSSAREEALRSVLSILKEVYRLRVSGELKIRSTAVTFDKVTVLLKLNNISEDKGRSVLKLLEHWC